MKSLLSSAITAQIFPQANLSPCPIGIDAHVYSVTWDMLQQLTSDVIGQIIVMKVV